MENIMSLEKGRFETFTVLTASICRSIRKIKTEEMSEFNLKSQHVSCLYYIYKSHSLTAKELCVLCEEDKANISRALKCLEDEGYLRCNSKLKKRYQSPLELTERGEHLARKVAEKIDNVLNRVSEGLSDGDRTALYRSLALIEGNLKRFCDGYEEK